MIPRWFIPLVCANLVGCQWLESLGPPAAIVTTPPPVVSQAEPIIPGATIITETETIEPLYTGPMVPQAVPMQQPVSVPQHVYPVAPVYPGAPGQAGIAGPAGPGAAAQPGAAVAGAPQPGLPPQAPSPPNPIHVPVANDEHAWEQIADVTSDYFRIAREIRARRGAEITTEGFIETAPQGGATILEPQRGDSVGNFNRWESTLQSIRRRCLVRVVPESNGYSVSVEVLKELEDLPRPEQSTAGASTLRNEGPLPPRESYDVSRTAESGVWIPLGRDVDLEQQMLTEIRQRLAGPAGGQSLAAN